MALVLPQDAANDWLGSFGERWFHTLCTAAGCVVFNPDKDQVHSDFVVHNHDHEMIRAQLKTTEHPVINGDEYRPQFPIKAYDRLRQGATRGFLIYVVVHQPHPHWTRHFRRGASVRASVHWLNLTGMPEKPGQASVTLSVPMGNMLTPAGVLALFPADGNP